MLTEEELVALDSILLEAAMMAFYAQHPEQARRPDFDPAELALVKAASDREWIALRSPPR